MDGETVHELIMNSKYNECPLGLSVTVLEKQVARVAEN